MPLNSTVLAKILWGVLSPVDRKTGAPDPKTTSHMDNYASGFVSMIKAAKVVHLPGTVTATAAPVGSSIKGGAASAGTIISVVGAIMSGEIAKGGDPVIAAGALIEAEAIAAYIMSAAKVDFAPKSIFGKSTATGSTPGVVAPDPASPNGGSNGKISGLSGSALAKLVVTNQMGPKKVDFYTELCNYLMNSGMVTYPLGSIVGVCTTSGQLTGGSAAGGTIS